MQTATFQFDFPDLDLSVSQIENVIGFSEGEDNSMVTGLIEEVLAESAGFCCVRAGYRMFDEVGFDYERKSVAIGENTLEIRKIIFTQLQQSDSVALFMCTAGDEIGMRSSRAMKEGDLLKGYIYDVVGSEIAEAAADLMQAELERAMLLVGKKITNRYSPGYCGWDVSEQRKLFQLFPGDFCGIRLTDSALMNPVKSVSGIIGIGRDVRYNPYTCVMCNMKNCTFSRIRKSKQ
jgi:hypothetical protein